MNEKQFIVTVLGSGTSQGIPVIACDCEVCSSTDSRDKRLRSSIMLTINGLNYVIDTGPDFRQQMLREKVQNVEAIFFTHEHKDHTAGLDDVRSFNHKYGRKMKIYCDKNVDQALHRDYHYAFASRQYPGIPQLNIEVITKNSEIEIAKRKIIPIEVMHHKLPVLGFRYGDFTYITDAKTISETEKEKIRGTKILIVNALRKEAHLSHFNLSEALNLVNEIAPEQAYLTHISHFMGKHADIEPTLPKNVKIAYDGLKLLIEN